MNKERLTEQFLEIVQIDSESGQERQVADYLIDLLNELELSGFEDNSQAETGYGAGNLIYTLKGESDISPIAFMVHMDTVTPGNGVKPHIEDGYVYSDGTTILGSDDKAGISAIIEAVRHIKEENIPHGDVEVVITVGEETGLVGAKALDIKNLKSKFGYAVDGTGQVGTIVNRAPSQTKLKAKIYGKKAHAGIEPEKGISAINIAAKAISKMTLGRLDEETTSNIGTITGGQATNIVADYAEILAEVRSLSDEKLQTETDKIKKDFEETAKELGGNAEVEVELMYPSLHAHTEDPVITTAEKAIQNIDRQANIISLGGGSDGNIFHGRGVPTAILGVGYEYIHTTSERMPLEELYKMTELIVEIVKVHYENEK
ncbi:M20/M25/M40 family metallo-hydrolase [Jeotgalicoccus meleagridis]|uniref:Peptidase T n=1 Tax=Jeotgalicoccus meleagridis TaxID=2759181 RepID=A0A6V7RK80_9STAP|nr:M20/M25/M40 family metallo-hydrolase [Jeotgalicoccus meleagridis]CAD2077889.1 Peptidase T [Jeotgalicoccus meleagridis]HIW37508.1 M20/M25/M40 family metallo-hydrolase [Candidatus Jeotgalicoccus stercoravium]